MNQFQRERLGNLALFVPYTDQMICARANVSEEVDTCQGDSGGPLIREVLKNFA